MRERKKEERERVRAQLKGISPFFTGKRSNRIKSNATLSVKNERFAYQESPREHFLLLVRKRTPLLAAKRTPKLLLFAKFASLSIDDDDTRVNTTFCV